MLSVYFCYAVFCVVVTLVFLMIRRPPRSTRTDTLFPYTTLFRSSEEREAFLAWQRRIAAHVCVQVLDPQTLAYALHDSPVGLLAWLVERRRSWGDCREGLAAAFDRDFLTTPAMIYWSSEERRFGKECVSTCRTRGSPYHYKKKTTTKI